MATTKTKGTSKKIKELKVEKPENISEADFFFLILCSQNILFDI